MDHREREKRLIEKIRRAGQGHIFRWFGELDSGGRRRLLDQVERLDLELLAELVKEHVQQGEIPRPAGELAPAPIIVIPTMPEEKSIAREAGALGGRLLRQGKVAALTVAGGQGSRLGFEGPKGTFPIAPITGKTIFQLLAEKFLANTRRYGSPIRWYIMTSEANDAATRDFFSQHSHFGLDAANVRFFQQGMLPAIDRNGKLILDAKDHVFTSPDGHGGTLLALKKNCMIEDMKRRGIEEVSYFQVDNVLIKVVDPVFIGCHVGAGAEMSSKVIRKRDPEEKLGTIGRLNGKLTVIEYSDLTREEMYATDEHGGLKYSAGSIAIHIINVDFMDRIASRGVSLPYHRANKSVPFLNEQGERVLPEEKNGIKFETFVFDALRLASNSVTMEVIREEEFAPVKDAEGLDSPETARRALVNMWGGWLKKAGIAIPTDQNGDVEGLVEISPLFALDAGQLAGKLADQEIRFDGKLLLE